jgi:hypothetical protein
VASALAVAGLGSAAVVLGTTRNEPNASEPLRSVAAEHAQLRGGATEEICSVHGEWARSEQARWLHSRLKRAGWTSIGCSGSAFDVFLDESSEGSDAYIWTAGPARDAATIEALGYRHAGQVDATGVWTDGTRLVWRGGETMVYAAAGPTSLSRSAPMLDEIRRVVEATSR